MTAVMMSSKNIWLTILAALASAIYLKLADKVNSGFTTDLQINPSTNKFYHEDYEKYLNVFVIHHSVTDQSIHDILDNHNVFEDEEYLNNRDYYDKNARLYGSYINEGGEKDRRFYCSYAGKDKGYGIYADFDIQKGTLVGVYTGMITNATANKDYAWFYAYSNTLLDGEKMDISIDSRVYGNFLRFVNHDDDPNTKSIAVPYKNRWHRVYVAIKNIKVGEEVTVSYGSYWETRNDYKKI